MPSSSESSVGQYNRNDISQIQRGSGEEEGFTHIKVKSTGEQFFKRFGVTEKTISFEFVDSKEENPLIVVENAISELLTFGLKGVSNEDYVGMVITSTVSPDRPTHISFRKKRQISK